MKVSISAPTPWTVVPQKHSVTGAAHQSEANGHMKKAGFQMSQPEQMRRNLQSESKLKTYGAAGSTGK